MNRKRYQKLHQIYRRIPSVKCKGLCTDNCTVLGMSEGEYQNMTRTGGKEPAINPDLSCNYLENGRCSIYNERPAICRIYGTAEFLLCPYGCKRERTLSPQDGFAILDGLEKEFGANRYNAGREIVRYDVDRNEYISALGVSNMAYCSVCREHIIWLSKDSEPAIPINFLPEPKGTIEVHGNTKTYRVLTTLEIHQARKDGAFLHSQHFCLARQTENKRSK
jgi:Fe-S-cluster containining protein